MLEKTFPSTLRGRLRTSWAVVAVAASAVVGVAVGGAPASAASVDSCQTPTNIVVNCGFETGDYSGWTIDGNSGFDYVSQQTANSGSYAYFSGTVGGTSDLKQALTRAQAGMTYAISFAATDLDNSGPRSFSAAVDSTLANGNTVSRTLLSDGANGVMIPTGSFATYSFQYTVPTTTVGAPVLRFSIQNDPSYYGLDSVSVTPLKLAKLSKVSGAIGSTFSSRVTDAATGAPLNTGQVAYYGTPGFLCTAQVVNGLATCSVPAAQRGHDLIIQLTKGTLVVGYFSAPGYFSAQATNGGGGTLPAT